MGPVDPQHHPDQPGLRLPEGLNQSVLLRELGAVDQQAEQAFPLPVGAYIHMPDQTAPLPLVIGRNPAALHPIPNGPAQAGGGFRLKQAVVHVNDLMAPGPVKADFRSGGRGKLHLIAVALLLGRAENFLHPKVRPADAP